MKPPPPMPQEYGSVTPRAAAVATAASTALPPPLRTCIPTCDASWSTEATAPPVPVAVGCFEVCPDFAPSAPEVGNTRPKAATRTTIFSRCASERFMYPSLLGVTGDVGVSVSARIHPHAAHGSHFLAGLQYLAGWSVLRTVPPRGHTPKAPPRAAGSVLGIR